MGDLVYLDVVRARKIVEDELRLDSEVAKLKEELQALIDAMPDDTSGYFLSIEETERLTREWEEKEKRNSRPILRLVKS